MMRQDEANPPVVSEKVIRRVMGAKGLRPVYLGKPRRWSSYKGKLSEAPANLIQPHVQREPLGDVWRGEAIRRITREQWEDGATR